jgi:hypothetical protein
VISSIQPSLEVKKGGERAEGIVEKLTLTREAVAVVPKKRVLEVESGGGGGCTSCIQLTHRA